MTTRVLIYIYKHSTRCTVLRSISYDGKTMPSTGFAWKLYARERNVTRATLCAAPPRLYTLYVIRISKIPTLPPHPVYLVYTPLFPLACDFCTTRRRIRVKNIYKWPAYVLYIYASCAFFSVSTGERNNTWCAVSAWNRREAESGGGVLLPSDSVVADKNAHENFT